eukprot:31346-Pelagococcus_subviridis.AAC.4
MRYDSHRAARRCGRCGREAREGGRGRVRGGGGGGRANPRRAPRPRVRHQTRLDELRGVQEERGERAGDAPGDDLRARADRGGRRRRRRRRVVVDDAVVRRSRRLHGGHDGLIQPQPEAAVARRPDEARADAFPQRERPLARHHVRERGAHADPPGPGGGSPRGRRRRRRRARDRAVGRRRRMEHLHAHLHDVQRVRARGRARDGRPGGDDRESVGAPRRGWRPDGAAAAAVARRHPLPDGAARNDRI